MKALAYNSTGDTCAVENPRRVDRSPFSRATRYGS